MREDMSTNPFFLNKMLTNSRSMDDIAAVCEEYSCSFNCVNIATALHRIATVHQRNHRANDQARIKRVCPLMCHKATLHAKDFKPQEVANLMWSLATLGMEPGAELTAMMSKRAVSCAGEFKPQEVANLMWSLATLGVEPGAELTAAMSMWAVS